MRGERAVPEQKRAYEDLESIFRAGVERVNPQQLIASGLRLKGDRLTVQTESASLTLDLRDFKRILVLGAGKASAAMAAGLEQILGDRISEGLVVVKYGHTAALQRIRLIESGHPLPDEQGVRGAEAVAELARGADAQTLVVNLVSGGGSAILPAPFQGEGRRGGISISLAEKQKTTQVLLACGVTIQEFNCIRKHISNLKGGRLAELLHPARSLNLILSDVVGDRLDTIASGLTVADETTYAQARDIVARYGIEDQLPSRVVELLRRGADGEFPETPKPGDPVFAAVTNVLLGTNYTALSAAARRAEQLGYTPVVLSSRIVGEAREVAKVLAAIAADMRAFDLLARRPACLLCGGETTVTLKGKGLGGRNQELALSFLNELAAAGDEARGIYFLSAATDGNDGPTDAAGAFASADIVEQARARDLSIPSYLSANDSYHFYEAIDGLLKTGPTNTNVCDLQICLIF
ncbi:MAG: glycerate kinase [Spirochaetaceae bacterium]|nr:MAG: glycerate kinase [Spirochaetaceae bacterium]